MDSKGDVGRQELARAWAASRRKPMLWGWILQGYGLVAGIGFPFLYNLLDDRRFISEELNGSLFRFGMDLSILSWYLLLGLICYLALDRISFLGEGSPDNASIPGTGGILKSYSDEFSSAFHLIGLLILPSILVGWPVYSLPGVFHSINTFGLFHGIASEFLLLLVNILNLAVLVLLIVGLSLFVSRLGFLRCAALGVLAKILIGKLDRFISFRLQLLSADLIGHNTAAYPNALDLGMVYAISIGSLVTLLAVAGLVIWFLKRQSAPGGPESKPQEVSPDPAG